MKKIYKVTLTAQERVFLTKLVSTGKSRAQKIKHANILLALDETENGWVEGHFSRWCSFRSFV